MGGITLDTSGWRGIIAEDFTFTGVRAVSQAVGEYFRSLDPRAGERGVVIGYDTRFLSEAFAAQAARILAAQGIRALLCERDTPTPVVASEILRRQAAGGIIVTAGHHPPEYNGIRVSGAWGGPASPEATRQIQARANALLFEPRAAEIASGRGGRAGPDRAHRSAGRVSGAAAGLGAAGNDPRGAPQGRRGSALRNRPGLPGRTARGGRLRGPRAPRLAGPEFRRPVARALGGAPGGAGLSGGGDLGPSGPCHRWGGCPVRPGGRRRELPGVGLFPRAPLAPPGQDAGLDRRRGAIGGDQPPDGCRGASAGHPDLRDAGRLCLHRRVDRQGQPSPWAATRGPGSRSRGTSRNRTGSWRACWPPSWSPREGVPGSGRCSRSCTRTSGRS